MSETRGTLHRVAEHLGQAVAPLTSAFTDLDSFQSLLGRLGWDAQDLPPSYAAAAGRAQAVLDALDAMPAEPDIESILAAVRKVGELYEALTGLTEAPTGVDPAAFLPEIGRALFDYLLFEYLRFNVAKLAGVLEAIGVAGHEDVPPVGGRPGYTRSWFKWHELPTRLADINGLVASVYGWGTDELRQLQLLETLSDLLIAAGLQVSFDRVEADVAAGYQAWAEQPPKSPIQRALTALLFDVAIGGEVRNVGLTILELPAEGAAFPGLVVQPLVPQGMAQEIDLGDGWSATLRAGTDLADQFGVTLRPDGIGVRYPFKPGAPPPSAGFGLSLLFEAPEPFVLFGESGRTRLEIRKASLFAELDLKAGDLEFKLGSAVDALALVVSAADLDGFLGSALAGKDVRIEFPLALSWSNQTGLNFIAGLGFELSAYPHLDFGAIRVDRVDLGVRFVAGPGEPPQLDLRVASALSGTIGPISYAVDRLGIHLPVTLEPGNAGPFDIGFGLLRPNGLGLVVDAGMVTGGGYVKLDPEKGRYFGMIELRMFEIAVTAIGILDTKDDAGNDLPSPGFSFFISVAVELAPIQLGYGFTLLGVGGLAGINRRMNTDAILSGVRQGALDSIMFPDDPVANATTILSNLSAIFPPAINRYVFGPMAMIGWGTPTLIRIELAIVLELPAPIRLVLLGKASVAIPTDETAIVSINLDVVGILDFGRSLFAVDASLRDSYLASFALSGDMAMRLAWGDDPNFAMAVGGLNPHFAPPAGFPSLRRITVALGKGNSPRISLEGYFAVTSNSLQFGARAELYASAAGFSIKGGLGFDALLVFEPLSFRFEFAAGMTLSRGATRIAGITVRGTLTGPSPFHAWGEGCISFFFFDVCVPFDATFGDEQAVDLAPSDPWPLLEAAIKTAANWSSELPANVLSAVSIRMPPPGTGDLLLEPMGAATLRQKVLPFNRPLERFGEFEITGPARYDIADVSAGSSADPPWVPVTDHFAPANYENLSDTEKLSRDSFERMDAGVRVGSDLVDFSAGAMKVATVAYETRVIDAGWKVRRLPVFLLQRAVQVVATLRGAKASSPLSKSGRGRFANDSDGSRGVRLLPETYGIASTVTLAAVPEIAAGRTRGAAHLALKEKRGRGAQASGFQVVPSHELERAS